VFGKPKSEEGKETLSSKELAESVLDLLGKATDVMERLEKVLDKTGVDNA
jgi:hypothetical protein